MKPPNAKVVEPPTVLGLSERWAYAELHPDSYCVNVERDGTDPFLCVNVGKQELCCFSLGGIPKGQWDWLGQVLLSAFRSAVSGAKSEATNAIYRNIHAALKIPKL